MSVQYAALILLTPFIPLDKSDLSALAVQIGFVDVLQVELQFPADICAIICAFVIVVVGLHAALDTYEQPVGEHLYFRMKI